MRVSQILLPVAVVCTVLASGCKKKKACEEWPDGYEYYDTEGSEDVEICSTPIIKATEQATPTGTEATYQLHITSQQGVADVIAYAGENSEQFRSGDTFVAKSGEQNSNKFNVLYIVCNDRWYNQSVTYWRPNSGRFNITEFDEANGTISGELEYEIAATGSSTEVENYRVVLEEYPITFTPN